MKYAGESGMTIVEVDPAEQARVDRVFDEVVRGAAKKLDDLGIDGEQMYFAARELSPQIANGEEPNCE